MSDTKNNLIGKKFPVLNDGFVRLIDHMGTDADIVQAARVSYGKGTRKYSEDLSLIRYLMRNKHSSPFEMAEIKLHIRMPMDSWRQMVRHRTANINEYSTRYSEAIDSCQTTESYAWRLQMVGNKQGSDGFLPMKLKSGICGQILTAKEQVFHQDARELYQERLAAGIAREQARKDLPLSTYTEAFWKCDLRNVLGFLALRMDGHAQEEIRSYANIIGREIVAKLFPMTWNAFEEYTLGAVTLSRTDQEAIRQILTGGVCEKVLVGLFENKRERDECRDKLKGIGVMD